MPNHLRLFGSVALLMVTAFPTVGTALPIVYLPLDPEGAVLGTVLPSACGIDFGVAHQGLNCGALEDLNGASLSCAGDPSGWECTVQFPVTAVASRWINAGDIVARADGICPAAGGHAWTPVGALIDIDLSCSKDFFIPAGTCLDVRDDYLVTFDGEDAPRPLTFSLDFGEVCP